MTLNAVYRFTRSRTALWAFLSLAALGLAACSGDELADPVPGDTGPPGPPGPPGGTAAVIGYSKLIKATIAAVNVPEDGRPILDIYLVDENGQKLKGLKAANISFVLARLETPPNGKSTTWRAVTRRLEPFPGSPPPQPPSAVTGTRPTNQAWTESAEAGTWDDSKDDGTYRYTFAKSLKGDAEIPYDGSLAHRVGLEIRLPSRVESGNIPANNAVYTFSPALNIPVTATREIVDNDTCNACHDNLSFHGGARFDLQYCAMCHESYSFDAQTGNAIDLKVMVHRIHRGEALPTGPYAIFGYNNTYYDFSDTKFSQDTRNCQTCHDESDADTPQASNWRVTVNREACGSCHDDVNFDTGAGHAGVAASADQCATCHGPTSNFGLRADQVHFDPLLRASEKFKYEVVRVVDTRPGQSPTVTIRVTDPTNNNAPYDITAPGGPFQSGSASLRVDVAWSTRPDFTNTGSGSAAATTGTPAQPISIDFKANGVPDPTVPGGFKATAAVAIPADATGSGSALLEGRPNVLIDGTLTEVPVNSAGRTFAITDATPQAYRTVVDINKCNDCHKQVSLHGENRAGNAELCAVCHNPNATDINRRVAGSKCETVTGTLDDQAIDFKVMVHEIHAGPVAGYKVCGYNNEGYDFSYVQYPGKLNNCEGCHLPNTYYPPGSTTGIATTFDAAPAANPSRATPLGDIATSPGAAVCSSCHKSQSARIHMISVQSGGSFDAVKAADSSIPGAPVEVCGNCHGNGSSADVKKVHGVGEFQYN